MTRLVDLDESPLAKVLGCLEAENCNPRRGQGEQWSARCPAHDDRVPSLSLREGDDGRALVNCHAGCTTEAVMAALELPMAALYPQESRQGYGRRSTPEKAEPSFGPDDKTFGFAPSCLILNACPTCLRAYCYLAWRCGKDNRPQRGIRAIARALDCVPRTATIHLEYLAYTGWVWFEARTTATGARRASRLSLRNCPALGIFNPDAMIPSRIHLEGRGGVTGASQSPGEDEGEVVSPEHHFSGPVSALRAPPSARSEHQLAGDVVQPELHALGTWYEHVGLGESESDDNARDLSHEELDALEEQRGVDLVLACFPGSEIVRLDAIA